MKENPNPQSIMLRDPVLRSRAAAGKFPSGAAVLPVANATPGPAATAPRRKKMQPPRGRANRSELRAGEPLLGMGRSLRMLAITVIVVLSGGLALLFYAQLRQSEAVANMLGDAGELLGGFGFLMLLTVAYLVSKHLTTSRDQHRMIEQILAEEAVARALRQNPITDFHHPEVCRDILMQQASHAARLHAPLSLLELNLSHLGRLSAEEETRPQVAELIRQIRGLCRATDSVLRWTPDSFLLAFPEVTRDELAPVTERLRQELEQWLEMHYEPADRPVLLLRGASSSSLESCGDILLEAQRLLEREGLTSAQTPDAAGRPGSRRERGIALALELEIRGETQSGKSFQEKVRTERVAGDRFWCVLKCDPLERSPLIVAAPDGAFAAEAMLVRWMRLFIQDLLLVRMR